METVGILVFLATLFVVLGYWHQRVSSSESARLRKEISESKDRGTHLAQLSHPQIDVERCIGCASCVRACPEDEVLGLLDGVAHVIHGSRCLGHGQCAATCPVGAIRIGFGETARSDLPRLSQELETTVPGVFIAGELAGLGLIRNAVAQGTRAVETIASRLKYRRPSRGAFDVLIVGAGPAGLAATLKAVETGLTYCTIEQDEIGGSVRKYPRRKLTTTEPFDLPLHGRFKKGEYSKEELIRVWRQVIRKFRLRIHTRVRLLGVQQNGGLFTASSSAGRIRSRTIVLALGRRGTPRKLGVPGEAQEKVLYQLTDAATYQRQNILVVGGGDSAIEAAMGLANQPGNAVTLSYRRARFFRLNPRNAARIQEYIRHRRIRVLFSSAVSRIDSDAVHLRLAPAGRAVTTMVLRNDYTFVFAGGEPPYPLLREMGVRLSGNEGTGVPQVPVATFGDE